ncbi:Thymidylate kinase [Tolypocladium capitatum]|uniref:Thymidylate kinase n=1 Tax=Tolypocladium capitatum TaxID=45235 RepID=A0A2K3PZ52_9HYPO|nr:Thymidylate kinase [Tolypocladium capitatum]
MASINDLATAAIASSTATAGSSADQRGAFIVLEGLDRSGKTTQVKLLEQRFVEEGRPVKVMRFPNRTTPTGQIIDAYLKSHIEIENHVIHLLFSANRWEAANQIHSLLAAGTIIICDRFYHSGIIYSAAKQHPSLSLSWARAPDRGLPRPDMVLFLDLDEARAEARGGWGDELYEEAGMQRTVRKLFREMMDGEGGGGNDGLRDLVAVDAGRSVEEQTVRKLFREMTIDGEGGGGDDGLRDLVAVDAGRSIEEDVW